MTSDQLVTDMVKFQDVIDKAYSRLTLFIFYGFATGFITGAVFTLLWLNH